MPKAKLKAEQRRATLADFGDRTQLILLIWTTCKSLRSPPADKGCLDRMACRLLICTPQSSMMSGLSQMSGTDTEEDIPVGTVLTCKLQPCCS